VSVKQPVVSTQISVQRAIISGANNDRIKLPLLNNFVRLDETAIVSASFNPSGIVTTTSAIQKTKWLTTSCECAL
jgi:hypothetical protein